MYVDDGSSYIYVLCEEIWRQPPVAQNLNKKSIADGFSHLEFTYNWVHM